MKTLYAVLLASWRAELLHVIRTPLFFALVVVQAMIFLFLVSLFGLTGSRAPTALVDEDHGIYAQSFIDHLANAHHSLDLRTMDKATALEALHQGRLVGMITIARNFSLAIAQKKAITLQVTVDNVNTDMTADVERALPSAIVSFGQELHLKGLRLQTIEVDLIDHDTGFVPYLVVSGLALDTFLIASILSAMAVAREFETGTIKVLTVAPVPPLFALLGRMLATDLLTSGAMALPVALAIFGYGIYPRHPLEMMGIILLCVAIFGCIGVTIGALLKHTLPVVSLLFGLGFPFYLGSGSLEPQRFDGNLIWILAHVSPVYYAVGLLEQAFHGFSVTPEPSWVNFLILVGWALFLLLLASLLLHRTLLAKTPTHQQARGRRSLELWNWHDWKIRLILPAASALLVTGGGFWFWQQHQQAVVQRAPQQQSTAVARNLHQQQIRLLSDYKKSLSFLLSQDRLLHKQVSTTTKEAASRLTLQILPQLDPDRKGALLQFLYSSKLIAKGSCIINLQGADLRAGKFAGFTLTGSILTGADFREADLQGVNLRYATLSGVNLSEANLAGADLREAEMYQARVSNANLASANLLGTVGINAEQLLGAASLSQTTLPDGSVQSGAAVDSD